MQDEFPFSVTKKRATRENGSMTARLPIAGYFRDSDHDIVNTFQRRSLHGSMGTYTNPESPKIKFPWGVNAIPVLSHQSAAFQIPSSKSLHSWDRIRDGRRERIRNSNVYTVEREEEDLSENTIDRHTEEPNLSQVPESSPHVASTLEQHTDKAEYIETGGFETLLDLVKSFFSALINNPEPSRRTPEYDIEHGLQDSVQPVADSDSGVNKSKFDELHSTPYRFPSSVDELLKISNKSGKSQTAFCLPVEEPPRIPNLPRVRKRNYDFYSHSYCSNLPIYILE
jgi:hypothetical protein